MYINMNQATFCIVKAASATRADIRLAGTNGARHCSQCSCLRCAAGLLVPVQRTGACWSSVQIATSGWTCKDQTTLQYLPTGIWSHLCPRPKWRPPCLHGTCSQVCCHAAMFARQSCNEAVHTDMVWPPASVVAMLCCSAFHACAQAAQALFGASVNAALQLEVLCLKWAMCAYRQATQADSMARRCIYRHPVTASAQQCPVQAILSAVYT